MNYYDYTNSNNWTGSFYELSIEFHPVGNNKRLNDALSALQNCNFIEGLWQDRENFQKNSLSLPIKIENDSVTHFYGTICLFDGFSLPCVVSIIRTNEQSDWLDIAIPEAILEKRYPYKYPLIKEQNPWLEKVDEVLIKLAEFIYKRSPFDLAMIGEEVSGYTNQQDITLECLDTITCMVPAALQKRLKVQGIELSNQLILF